jgi:hypothetical protein
MYAAVSQQTATFLSLPITEFITEIIEIGGKETVTRNYIYTQYDIRREIRSFKTYTVLTYRHSVQLY